MSNKKLINQKSKKLIKKKKKTKVINLEPTIEPENQSDFIGEILETKKEEDADKFGETELTNQEQTIKNKFEK